MTIMFNLFRRKPKFPTVWLYVITGLAVAIGLAAWVVVGAQWHLTGGLKAKYEAERSHGQKLAAQLHDMKQFEGTSVGTVRSSCGTLAQIGAFTGEPATAAGDVVKALKKRDPFITAADVGPILNSFYATADFGVNQNAGVPGIAVRIADGGLNWLDGKVVRVGGLYEARLTTDYLARHEEDRCGQTVDRPELTTCIPDYVTLMNNGIYIGDFLPGCEAQTTEDGAREQ